MLARYSSLIYSIEIIYIPKAKAVPTTMRQLLLGQSHCHPLYGISRRYFKDLILEDAFRHRQSVTSRQAAVIKSDL